MTAETPLKRLFVPNIGAFAVLKIDAVASLDYLGDPEALAEAARLVTKEYVVYVPGTYLLPNPSIAYREEDVNFVMQGLPLKSPEQGVDSSMSFPILPATRHPTSRLPLQPTTSFPWSNCYLSPFVHATVRCPNIQVEDPVYCKLEVPDAARFKRLARADRQRSIELSEARQPTGSVADTCTMALAPPQWDSHGPCHIDKSKDPAPLNQNALLRLFHNVPLQQEASTNMITVSFTHDLSPTKALNNPRGFFKEVEEIIRIADKCLSRKKTVAQCHEESEKESKLHFWRTTRGHSSFLSKIMESGKKLLRRSLFRSS